jgi:ribose/xylose/arabinose/galactoside ABC-type transport system permease subunit
MSSLPYTPAPAQKRSIVDMALALAAKREYGLSIVIAVIVIAATLRDSSFLSLLNIRDILVNCTQPAIVACGVMLVIVTGEIDISVGASLGLCTAICGTLMSADKLPQWFGEGHAPFGVAAAIGITVGVATLIGLINGILVTLVRVPSIIVTLAMLMILRSFSVEVMAKGNITDLPDAFRFFGIGTILGIRTSIWIMVAVLGATWALIRYTTIGRRIYAVGSNPHAATLAGLSVVRTKLFVFALTGFLVGIATFITPNGAIDNSTSSSGFELLVVTCIVVGGVSISGGVGTVVGVFLGVVLLQMQQTVLIFLKLSQNASNWNRAIQGALILIAVLVDHLAASRSRRGGGGGGGGRH